MEFVTEGNNIFRIHTVGNATIKEFYDFVVPPEPQPEPPNEVDLLKAQVDDLKTQLAVTNATVDFLLGI